MLRAYSVATTPGAQSAAFFSSSEFLHREGDPWEPIPVVAAPVIPSPETEPKACPLPAAIDDATFEPWVVDLHGAIGAVVEDANMLGASLTETEDFSLGWENRDPVQPRVAVLVADLEAVESVAKTVLQDQFGATYDEELEWQWPEGYVVRPAESHLEEIFGGAFYYRTDVLPAFFEMRTQGTAIGYFNSGGISAGPCGATKSLVLLLDTMNASGLFQMP